MKKILLFIIILTMFTFTVLGASPIMNSSRITPTIAYTNDTLMGYCNATDSDGNNIYYNYTWYVDGSNIDTGVYGNYVYQEDANSTVYDSFISNPTNAYDGDYSTYAGTSTTNRYIYFNYTKVNMATKYSLWQVKSGTASTTNLSIEESCWDYSPTDLVLRYRLHNTGSTFETYPQCYNNTDWVTLTYGSGIWSTFVYEEAIHWNVRLNYTEALKLNVNNLSSSYFSKESEVVFECTAYDSDGSSSSNSSTLTINNSIPIPTPYINESIAYTNTNLTMICNGADTDTDDVTYEYIVYKNGIELESNNEKDTGLSCYGANAYVQLVPWWQDLVYVYDGNLGTYGVSTSTIANAQSTGEYNFPSRYYKPDNNVTIEVTHNYYTQTFTTQLPTNCKNQNNINLTVNSILDDIRNDKGYLAVYCWNGSSYTFLASTSSVDYGAQIYDVRSCVYERDYHTSGQNETLTIITSDNFNKNDNITLSCKSLDNDIASYYINSSTLTISNTAPLFNQSLFTWSISHGLNDTLTLNASDLDSDTLSYSENSSYLTINSSTGIMSYIGSNDISRYGLHNISINVSDGDNYTISSFILNLTNTAPNTTSLLIHSLGTSNDNLTFTNTTTDLDNDTITIWSIKWFRDNIYLTALNNLTEVNSSYVNDSETWNIELSSYDGIDWTRTNSTDYIIGDGTKPVITNGSLSSEVGANDVPFIIYVNINEINELSSVSVDITDVNGVTNRFIMDYVSGNTTKLYSRSYTPGADGTYLIGNVYATDGNSNVAIPLNLDLKYIESTSITVPNMGGGGDISSSKQDCSLDYSIEEISLVGLETKTIIITNNDDISFTPNPVLPSELIGKIMFSIPTPIIFSGQKGELNFINIDSQLTGEGNIIITSDNCNDISIPITVRPTIFKSSKGFTEFFNVELFDLWGLSITNGVISALSLLTALSITLPNKKYTNRTKFLLIILIPLFVTFIFNFIFS